MRFDEQYSIKQVFKPEEDGRDKLVISVVDSGIGISRKDKLKLLKQGSLPVLKGQGIGLQEMMRESINE